MKKNDLVFIIGVLVFLSPFFLSEAVFEFYKSFNKEHGMIMSFVKFGVLATLGESIGLRIKNGVYNEKGFGLLPRAIVWGVLGMGIKMAFIIFATGAPIFVEYMGIEGAVNAMKEPFSSIKLLNAFTISTTMNLIFAPIFMTLHKVTDTHIIANGGSLKGFFSPIKFREIMMNLNWDVQYSFVFKKTIPLFWIPAHTVTFLLPPEYQILMAAALGVVLGVLLAIASLKK